VGEEDTDRADARAGATRSEVGREDAVTEAETDRDRRCVWPRNRRESLRFRPPRVWKLSV